MLRATRPDPEVVRARLRRLAGLEQDEGEPSAAASGRHSAPEDTDRGSDVADDRMPWPASRSLTVVAVAAVLVAGWIGWRGSGGDVAPTVVTTGAAASVPGAGTASMSPSPAGSPGPAATAVVVVQVVGAVRRPGVVTLPAGARVQDALDAAGGVRPGRSTGSLNLARRLVDGEQVVVGQRSTGAGPPAVGTPSSPAGAPVDLNLADATALDALPGVGPVTAAAILRWRDEHGGFASIEQLQEVDGIGPKTYAQLAPLVVVSGG